MPGGQPRGFRLDQQVAPRRRLDLAVCLKNPGPGILGDVEELQRELPVLVERIGYQPVKRAPFDPTGDHVVHQTRQIVGQRQRRCRTADHKRGLRGIARPDLLRPCRDQLRQQQAALQALHRWRRFQRAQPRFGSGLCECQLVFIDIAECDDARQQHGVGFQLVEKDFPRHAPGAAGRQIESCLRQFFRVCAGLEAFDQPAIDQRADNGAQERRRDWNAENTHGLPDSKVRRHHGMGSSAEGIEAFRRRWRETPLPPRGPRRGFPHASTPRRAAGRTAVPARWRDRTSSSAKIHPMGRRRTAMAT